MNTIFVTLFVLFGKFAVKLTASHIADAHFLAVTSVHRDFKYPSISQFNGCNIMTPENKHS